ncbi:TonB-dependent receptor plug domain-containing protein [Vibrio sp. PP-XX7]
MNKQDLSAPQLSAILVDQIERIEILSGSAGVLYGNNAVGGVINIITKQRKIGTGQVSASAGGFNSLAGSLSWSQHIAGAWNYSVNTSHDRSDNYREHNRRKTDSLSAKVNYREQDKKFYTELNFYDNDLQNPGSLTETQYNQNPTQANIFNQA